MASNAVTAERVVVEPPTVISLGVEWPIKGDDNRNAVARVSYRRKGDAAWREALPLLRVHHEPTINSPDAPATATIVRPIDYIAPNMFAGSIFDLDPDTEYEVQLRLSDPDGVAGAHQVAVSARTRREPVPAPGGRVFHVYPPDHTGSKEQPAFTGLLAAYYVSMSHGDWNVSYPPRVQPGDTILVHAGLYKANRWYYGPRAGDGAVFDGTHYLKASGTAERPIVIMAAGDGEAIFDGEDAPELFNVLVGNYNYFDGLTFRNAQVAIRGGTKGIIGSSGLTVKHCRFEDVGIGVVTEWSGSKDYYIADNVFVGRHDPNDRIAFTDPNPPKMLSYYAVKIYGQGHVVAFNSVANFHDGIDNSTYGQPDGTPHPIRDRMPVSNDIYNNDISNMHDNCIEADGSSSNMRVMRNRCFNAAGPAFSLSPVFAGPIYFLRNVIYHASSAFTAGPVVAGAIVYHNTLVGGMRGRAPVSNAHFRNNLFLQAGAPLPVFELTTMTNYSSSDYNGFFSSPSAPYAFGWTSPPFGTVSDYTGRRGLTVREFQTLKDYSAATHQDTHSVLVDYGDFQRVTMPDPESSHRVYGTAGVDFQLRQGSKAVDAGVLLPGVNGGFAGVAPDLGAYESGQPVPHYGPRTRDAGR